MSIHLSYWICIFGFLLKLESAVSNTTVTDYRLLNLIVENFTEASFDKQEKTNDYNSNDSFSLNSVNTGPMHSHQSNEECKNGDCSRNVYNSHSIDNTSTASKILWNFVSTVKSTNQHSVSDKINNDEGVTESPFNNAVNIHSHDHNSSSNSNDNELDSNIGLENDILNTTYSAEGINNSSVVLASLNLNFTATTSLSVENKLAKLYELEKNSTNLWESSESYPEVFTSDSYVLNVSEYGTTSDIPETTVYSADEKLDLTSLILNSFDLNRTEFMNEINNQSQVTENFTTEQLYSETDSLNYEYNESSTLFSVNNDMIAESENFGMNITNFEPYSVPYGENSTSLTAENENKMQVYHNYSVSLESEELKSKDNLSIITTELDLNAQIFHSTSAPEIDPTLLDETLWLMSDESFNNMPNSTVLNTDSSVDTELPISEPGIKPAIMTSIKHNSFSEKDLLPTEASRNISSTFGMIADSSTDTREVTDNFSYLSQETKMSTTHIGLFDAIQNISTMLNSSSENFMNNNLWNDALINGSFESTEITNFSFPEEVQNSNEFVSTVQDLSTTISTHINGSTENPLANLNKIVSRDLPASELINQNATSFASSMGAKGTDGEEVSSAFIEESLSTEKLNTDPNISVGYLNNVEASTQGLHSNGVNELDSLSSTQTSLATVISNAELEDTPTMYSVNTQLSFITDTLKENNTEDEIIITTDVYDKYSHFTASDVETDAISTSEIPNEILSSTEYFKNESNVPGQNYSAILISTETEGDRDFHTSGNSDKLNNHTKFTSLETISDNTENILQDRKTNTFPNFSTESVFSSHDSSVSTNSVASDSSENIHSSSEIFHYPKPSLNHSGEITDTMSSEKESMKEKTISVGDITVTKQINTDLILNTLEIEEVSTFSSPTEVSSLGITETYREGKHIPFSPTLVRSTTEYPRIFNVTVKTFSQSPKPETTENNFVNLYNQIKADELSPEERSNLINAVVKLPDILYSKEVLNEKIAIIHLWLLHAVADEYKNSTVNLAESMDGHLDEIEFENLPQILYVLPTPEIYLPNISFTFVVQNKWRNETFPVDIILTILNLHIEDLKHLVEIEDIHLSHGLLVPKHDLLSVIIEKYGIILLSTCLITVAMIFLLICVVIYYRRKTRHSAHCLTDDKLRRNMQEAMGIDLNPAVVILQEEIREKAALNGNKICNLNDDEGWLAPIGDVPVEDNNAPFVQDTKL